MANSDIVVAPVEGKADLKAFIQLPVRLFRGHKGYIPHLNTERDEAFSPKKNPLFKHVEVQFFLARRAGRVVGRITAQIDHAYLERYKDDTGHFGCLVAEDDPESGSTRISVFTPDREGLFYRICAGLASAGANIIDARIHTTRDGMALDNLLVKDGQGRAYSDRRLKNRLVRSVENALTSEIEPPLPHAPGHGKAAAFRVASSVAIAERASTRTTVVEVNARDRPALLAGLAGAFVLTRIIASQLFAISAVDPLTFTGVSLSLLAVALIACFAPARRATRVDPLIALRHE